MRKLDYLLKLFNELIGLPLAVLIYLVTPSVLCTLTLQRVSSMWGNWQS